MEWPNKLLLLLLLVPDVFSLPYYYKSRNAPKTNRRISPVFLYPNEVASDKYTKEAQGAEHQGIASSGSGVWLVALVGAMAALLQGEGEAKGNSVWHNNGFESELERQVLKAIARKDL